MELGRPPDTGPTVTRMPGCGRTHRHARKRLGAGPGFTHTNADAQVLTEVMKPFNTEQAVLSGRNIETAGYLYVKNNPPPKKKSLGILFLPFTKINSKWTKYVNVKCKTRNCFVENIRERVKHIYNKT